MFPLLFEIPVFGGIRIYTYGVLVALGFLIGIFWTVHEGKIAGVNPDRILDLSFYIILAALVGSRILYIFVDWQRYASHPLDILKIWEGGLVFYGGLIGAILVSIFYLRKYRLGFLKVADLFMPGVALGHGIGRLGCFAAGCCYGSEAEGFPLAITFPHHPYTLAPAGIPLYPTQLFESAAELLIFLFLVLLRKRKRFEGQIFLVYLALYSLSRAVLETFRGDSVRGFLIPEQLSTSQFISGGLVVFAIVLYWRLRARQKQGSL
jgi:phosphatidylglycerol:prolipoprotein diacylglycerol transferase